MRAKIIGLTLIVSTFHVSASQDLEDQLALLTGCWRNGTDTSYNIIEERWDRMKGGLMLGTSKTIRGGKAVEFEFLKIKEEKDEVNYTPYLNGTALVSFKLVKEESSRAVLVFENLKNDFPQRITYTQAGPDLFVKLIGGDKQVGYPLRPIDCK